MVNRDCGHHASLNIQFLTTYVSHISNGIGNYIDLHMYFIFNFITVVQYFPQILINIYFFTGTFDQNIYEIFFKMTRSMQHKSSVLPPPQRPIYPRHLYIDKGYRSGLNFVYKLNIENDSCSFLKSQCLTTKLILASNHLNEIYYIWNLPSMHRYIRLEYWTATCVNCLELQYIPRIW